MIGKTFRRIKHALSPPKPGDVYYGDVLYFILGNNVEFVLHGLTDKFGNIVQTPVPSEDCYRLTIVKYLPTVDQYACQSEVFCRPPIDNNIGNWKSRSQLRRIPEVYFKELVINGLLTKEKT